MLTKNDIAAIREIVKDEFTQLLTKVEFFGKMDEIMGELKAIREEQTLQSGILSSHTDTIEDHEARLTRTESSLKLPPIVS